MITYIISYTVSAPDKEAALKDFFQYAKAELEPDMQGIHCDADYLHN